MNDPALIERITRSLAFMLRHQPEQFDLELDAYGYADVGDVVHALNERLGEPVTEEDLEQAVDAGDRQRYEIEGTRIRALYGHSIPVEPGEPSEPPETLYVAIPERDVDRARRFGLRGGRRRFLHLALSEEEAREAGRRGARDYTVLSVHATEAWEEGVNFYDRRSLWLAEEVPTHLLEVGDTFHDGEERVPRGRVPSRPRERDARGGRGERDREERGDEERDERRGRRRRRGGRGRRREESRERAAGPREAARSHPRDDEPRRVPDRERPWDEERDERRPEPREERRDRRPERREPGRPERGPERRPERPERRPVPREERPAQREERPARPEPARSPAPVASGGGPAFGAGLREPAERERPRPAPAPQSPAPEPREPREPRPAPEPPRRPEGGGFGAGL